MTVQLASLMRDLTAQSPSGKVRFGWTGYWMLSGASHGRVESLMLWVFDDLFPMTKILVLYLDGFDTLFR